MASFIPDHGWGPDAQRAALAITFDNLGEAGHLERGQWDGPVGEHFTAGFVPRLIQTLAGVPATYFIEASNVALYPRAISAWHDAGNEVGVHAWRHESWGVTPPARRRDLLAKSMAAMRSLGIEPVGFRPPGGALQPEAWDEFAEAGLLYCSEYGEPGIRRMNDMLSLPFAWHDVDAFVIEELASPLRVAFGAPAAPQTLADWIATLDDTLDAALAEGGQRTVIFHPEFIGASEEKLAVLRRLIRRAQDAGMWIARARDIAAFAATQLGIPRRQAVAA